MNAPWNLEAESHHSAEDLTIWHHPWPKCKNGVAPSEGGLPNPVIADGAVVGTVFSPGAFRAFDVHTGDLLWHQKAPSLADGDPIAVGDQVFVRDSNFLVLVHARSGKSKWQVEPARGKERVWISGAPQVVAGNVLIVDTAGKVYSYGVEDGVLRWITQVSRRRMPRINGQPWTDGEIVVVGSNAGLVTGIDLSTGARRWQRRLRGPVWTTGKSLDGLITLVGWDRVYGLCPATGEMQKVFRAEGREISTVAVGDGAIFVVLRRNDFQPVDDSPEMCFQQETLVKVADWRVRWDIPYPPYPIPSLMWSPETGKLYEATQWGLGIVDPATGVREHSISGFPNRRGPTDLTSTPAVTPATIHVVTSDGSMMCLRHP